MLQLFKKWKGIMLDKMEDIWQGRFKFGTDITAAALSLNRFTNGSLRFAITLGKIVSCGTGHWPFALLDAAVITGRRGCFHFTVCGVCVGCHWLPDLGENDETGAIEVVGPDYLKMYIMFTCINHQNQKLEEITSDAK